jgi:surface protein
MYIAIVGDRRLQELHRQWQELDDGALVLYTLSFFDFKTLLRKETVSKSWRKLCQRTIDAKCGQDGTKAFQSKQELRGAVFKYCKHKATSMEEIACTYGYPIDKWDVSQVEDMTEVFAFMNTFNQDLGSWNVANVTSTTEMFRCARAFNRYISSWDVSNVTHMRSMFDGAVSFNQNIGNWDVSNVTDMAQMFRYAKAFNQDIGSWDVSSVTDMTHMFYGAAAFNQNVSPMFRDAW